MEKKKRDKKGWKEYKQTNFNENGKLVALEGRDTMGRQLGKSIYTDLWEGLRDNVSAGERLPNP